MIDPLDIQKQVTNAAMVTMQRMLTAEVECSHEGQYLITASGRKYLNLGGYGIFLLGGNPKSVLQAVTNQMQKMAMSTRLVPNTLLGQAAAKLLSPQGGSLATVIFANSGAEATEIAVKIAKINGCNRLIGMDNAFHGKTTGALALSGRGTYQAPFRPLLDVEHVPFGDIDALQHKIRDGGRSAVIVEPIQGEAGVVFPPEGYLSSLGKICQEADAILIVDEIQTGLGRLGCWWEYQAAGCNPDIVLSGKVLSGGVYPIAAVSVTSELYKPFDGDPLLHSSTYAGSPAACATVLAVMDYLEHNQVPDRADKLGRKLSFIMNRVLKDPQVLEVRGKGLLWAVEFLPGAASGEFLFHCMDYGIIPSTALNSSNIIRFTPPVIIEENDIRAIDLMLTEWLNRSSDA